MGYLSDRKLLLVNGMHTTLAFMTMREAGLEEPSDLILLKYPDMSPTLQREVWLWALSRIAILLHNHSLETIKAVHGLETEQQVVDNLVAYAETALDRFASADDAVARVLGGGVANRWKGRLLSVLMELKDVEIQGLDSLAIRFLNSLSTPAASSLVKNYRSSSSIRAHALFHPPDRKGFMPPRNFDVLTAIWKVRRIFVV